MFYVHYLCFTLVIDVISLWWPINSNTSTSTPTSYILADIQQTIANDQS